MLHAVIMAGGAGTRFWPASRADWPKQLLALVGKRTMIQSTVDRLNGLVPGERTWVVTNRRLTAAIAEQLPGVGTEQILSEPCKRDTAPCIGLAALEIVRDDPDAVMAVMPADHVIQPERAFVQAIEFAARLVADDPERIVTFGVTPTYPAQSFGYIERGAPLTGLGAEEPKVFRVAKFHEKPKADVARQYFDSGKFYWNSGIFIWRAQTIIDALTRYQPEMVEHLKRIAAARDQGDYQAVLEREFAAIRPISIDYAVMERTLNDPAQPTGKVVVVEVPFEWDDVGSWQAIGRLNAADDDGNVIEGRHVGVATKNTIVRSDDKHLVVTMGIKDCIVVHTPESTLVANKHDEESIRELIKLIEERGWHEYL
ncbi:MAG TPA: mannose-1-phosphate guanylyltransferase [Pirellulales bacterium]|nr:mannose-1-phosphate guanylyltransferase [Pirellulales bacterium]